MILRKWSPNAPVPESRTVLAKSEKKPEPGPSAPRKKTGLWIGLGGAALLVCLGAVAGIIILRINSVSGSALSNTNPG